jgi:hypothetical protein
MVQEVAEDNPDHRIQFCKQMMNLIDNNQTSLASTVFSDETIFTLHGEVNCGDWAVTVIGHHWMRETHILGIHDLFGTELAMIFSFHVGLTDSVMQRVQFFFCQCLFVIFLLPHCQIY